MARRRWSYSEDDNRWVGGFPPSSRPLPAKGGIRAQSTRGRFVESWWAERWIAVLESFEIGGRLGRGRTYARRGQVLSLEITNGAVVASVQGSRPTPYEVTIAVKTLGAADWARVVAASRREAVFAAKLLAGEMPHEIEVVFERANLSLFPTRSRDLKTHCSCPDPSNPCKHIAAVYYLLGEEFDRDPFLLFALRGLPRDALVEGLTAPAADGESPRAEPGEASPAEESLRPQPDPTRPESFWRGGEAPQRPREVQRLEHHADVLRRLGKFPFWRGEQPLQGTLEPVYAEASAHALARLADDSERKRQ